MCRTRFFVPAWAAGLVLALACFGCTGEDSPAAGELLQADGGSRFAPLLTGGVAALVDPGGPADSGRWRVARRSDRGPSQAEDPVGDDVIDQLRAIGYAAGSEPASTRSGVVVHDSERVQDGVNFVLSAHRPEAVLMDMDGRVLHSWRKSFAEIWPNHPEDNGQTNTLFWRRAFVYPNGDLLAMFEGLCLVKLDRNSELLWARALPVHHDLEVLQNGDIWVLCRRVLNRPEVAAQVPGLDDGLVSRREGLILEDFVTRLGQGGRVKENISLIDCFENAGSEHDWPAASKAFWDLAAERDFDGVPRDVFHANAITMLQGEAADQHPAFRRGNLLVSLRHLDMLAVIDPRSWQVVWSMTGATAMQHDPTITRDGRLLVFDNHWKRARSRVVAFDVATKRVAWQYGTSDTQSMYSETCGTSQALGNRNVLVTESDNGRALEITPKGDVVWEFLNPQRAGDEGQFVATLFEVLRLPVDFGAGWL